MFAPKAAQSQSNVAGVATSSRAQQPRETERGFSSWNAAVGEALHVPSGDFIELASLSSDQARGWESPENNPQRLRSTFQDTNDADSRNSASLTPEQRSYFEPRFGRDFQATPSVDQVVATPGRQLQQGLRQDMEQRFGYDFSRVRVHIGPAATQTARSLSAKAYTVGQDIVFEAGRLAPGSQEGRRLLAHELTHVVQAGMPCSVPQRSPDSIAALESEARLVANAVRSNSVMPEIRGSARGLGVPLREGKDDVTPPTFGNLPQDEPILMDDKGRPIRRVELVKEGEVWFEKLGKGKFRAEGTYDFVVRGNKIIAVKGSNVVGATNPGHTEAAGGGRVKYAGTIKFATSKIAKGTLLEWSNASGHYAPVKEFATAAGLPMDKFKPLVGPKPPMGPQLPVSQLKPDQTLEPRGRGGDVKRLGQPKTEPVPQKTIVKGEFDAKTAPPGKQGPVEAPPTPTKVEPVKTPPVAEVEAALTETAVSQELTRLSGGQARLTMGRIARVGSTGFAVLKVGGLLYTIYSLTQIRSLSDAGAFVASLGVGAAVSGIAGVARLGTGVGMLAGFALALDDMPKPSEDDLKWRAVYNFLQQNFTSAEYTRNRVRLEKQAYRLLFETKPFELETNTPAHDDDRGRAKPDYVECPPEAQCSSEHPQWLTKMRAPLMKSVREDAAAIRNHLMADPDRTAGAMLASDNLDIVIQTIDPKRALQAVDQSLSYLNYDTAFYPYPQLRAMRHTLFTIAY